MADPTQAGFLAFVRNQGVSTTVLPDASPDVVTAYDFAVENVSDILRYVAPISYVRAVYNLAMAALVEIATDQSGQNFFANLRDKFNIFGAVFGAVTTASDEGTSVSVEAPDFVKTLSLSDLQYLKTPWGRTYFSIAQKGGMNWGLS